MILTIAKHSSYAGPMTNTKWEVVIRTGPIQWKKCYLFSDSYFIYLPFVIRTKSIRIKFFRVSKHFRSAMHHIWTHLKIYHCCSVVQKVHVIVTTCRPIQTLWDQFHQQYWLRILHCVLLTVRIEPLGMLLATQLKIFWCFSKNDSRWRVQP